MSSYVSICHRLSEVSEEKQRRKKRSKDRKNQVLTCADFGECLGICLECREHDLHISAPPNWEGTK